MNITLRPATDDDVTFAFEVKRAALGGYVTQVWGWNEAFQREFHRNDWAAHRPDIIVGNDESIGTLEVVKHPDHLYVGEFYLLPAHQRLGIGTQLLSAVLERADRERLPVRLQFLKVNPVRSLYERHGFGIVDESPTHYFAVRPARIS